MIADRAVVQPKPQATLGVPRSASQDAVGIDTSNHILPVGATVAVHPPAMPPAFSDAAELSVEALVESVLARNPTVAEKVAAWQALQARHPQQAALDDPVFSGAFGPASIGSSDVNFAYRFEISQKYPWPGKLALRGQNAAAEASVAANEVEEARLLLAESARSAFYDYYLAERGLEVNAEALRLLKEIRENAQTRFTNKLAPQQDVFQADVEIGRQQERQLTLQRTRAVAVARINTLLHQPPTTPLPAPPKKITPATKLADVAHLQSLALMNRPELRAQNERITAAIAALGLAYKDYYPDLEPFLMYDRFMGNMPAERDLALQIGVRLNLPMRRGKRVGAVSEAQAKIAQQKAELARLTDQVNFEVQQAYEQVREAEGAVQLYEKTILPAASENVKAALTAYITNKVPFVSLVQAERSQVELRERYYEKTAEVFQRRAALERAVGGVLAVVGPNSLAEVPALTPPADKDIKKPAPN